MGEVLTGNRHPLCGKSEKQKPLQHDSATILHQKPVYLATLIKSGAYAELAAPALWFTGWYYRVCYKAMVRHMDFAVSVSTESWPTLHQLNDPEQVI